jgi:hypothetical protein
METYADLELALHRRDTDSYSVEMRYNAPDSEAEVRLLDDGAAAVSFDLAALRRLELDSVSYGQALQSALFANEAIAKAFHTARSNAQSQNAPLRLRLFIGPSAPELHSLHWETLRDPDAPAPLFVGEQILFSRYLSSLDWRPVKLRPKADLRALAAIANPKGLEKWKPGGNPLAPIDVESELARARESLKTIPVEALASGGSATLDNIIRRLRDGFDILYLVCHGALIDGEPKLWLENEAGEVARVSGTELVQRIRELAQRPRLVVLASCQSAGVGADGSSTDSGALAALGPRLAEAGIPAILAMQGNVTMETSARFTSVFFRELLADGQIDRAASVARGAVRDRPDYWIPVLCLRLRSGRIWYVPGFGDDSGAFDKWPLLRSRINAGKCTPILGMGLVESMFGSSRELARRWSETYHFPMEQHDREDLPHVAQYLSVNQDADFPRSELLAYLAQELWRTHADDLAGRKRNEPLGQMISAVGAKMRERNPFEPHAALASLPFPIYITTIPDDLMEDALRAAGRQPQSDLCRWKSELEELPEMDPAYRPDAQHPLVYHLFGRLSEPDSLVLTEDDYFDYLIGVTSSKDLIPGFVRRALVDTGLLFLGFRLEEWSFRVLFRSVMSQEGSGKRAKYTHVAAQIDPEEGKIPEPGRARKYLESYFQDSRVSIYWGNVDDFVTELLTRTQTSATQAAG